MIGATVTLNKHKTGAVVDMNGNFAIQLNSVKFPCTLIVQYVGYKTARVTIDSYRRCHNNCIVLEEDRFSLNDVVVVGYGKSSRKKLTGAVAKVTSSVISKATHEAPIMALQGNASGVYIEQESGVPGSGSSNLIIRGVSTLSSQSRPLYFIDGIPFKADGNVEVKVQANYATTASYVAKRLDFPGVDDYIGLRKKAVAYDLEHGYINESDYNEIDYPNLLIWNQQKDFNCQNSMLGDTSWGHEAQLQVSGGNKNTAFMVSSSFFTTNTVVQIPK